MMQSILLQIKDAIISTIMGMLLENRIGLIQQKLMQFVLFRKVRKRAEYLKFKYQGEASVLNRINQDAFYGWLKDKRTISRILSFSNAENRYNMSAEQMVHAKESFFVDAFHIAGISSWHEKEELRIVLDYLFQYVDEFFWSALDEKEVFLFQKGILEIRKVISEETEAIIRQIHYHDSFAEYINNEKLVQEVPYDLDYRSQKIPFVGRIDELKEIEKFCSFEEQICWWAIIGSGGSGKSRLTYKFIKQYTEKETSLDMDWKMLFLRDEFFSQINGGGKYKKWNIWTYEKNLLLVVDYVQKYAREVAEWIEGLANNISVSRKIRILLLERTDGENALWFKGIFDSSIMRVLQYPKEFLHLQSLDTELVQVAMQYAAKQHIEIREDVAREALDRLKDIDPEARILYYLMIIEAIFEDRSWRVWNKEQLVKHIIERERRMLPSRFCNDTRVVSSYNRLRAFCTATRELCIFDLPQDIPEIIENDITVIQNVFGNRNQLCAAMQLIDNIMHPVTPDIIGEYMVLYIIDQYIMQRTEKRRFIHNLWVYDPENFSLFIYRLIEDKMYGDDMPPSFNEIIELMLFYEVPCNNPDARRQYAMLMWGLSAIGSIEQTIKYIEILESLYLNYPNDVVVVESYAIGLFNLSCRQELSERCKTIETLEKLAKKKLDNEEIQFLFAKGLFNLSNKQHMSDKVWTMKKLEELAQNNSNNERIQIIYAKGLSNYSGFLVLEESQNTINITQNIIDKLGRVATEWSDSVEIQTAYARGLVNLSSIQELSMIEDTIRKLEKLSKRQTDNVEVQIEYARGLSKLVIKQDQFTRQETFKRLKVLSQSYMENSDIREIYERLLSNFNYFN